MAAEDIEESWVIRTILESRIPKVWDGRSCILELRDADYNWRQMEWIGWYFEYKARKTLIDYLGGTIGHTYGSTTFDFRNNHSWDLKTHPLNSSSHPWAIMNDCEAVDRCIEQEGSLGFVLALGIAQYNDADNSFKSWHDELKGGLSDYERDRLKRGASSRKRKTSFEVQNYLMILFHNQAQIDKSINEGWLGYFQSGMRNADGSPRRRKYKISVEVIPDWARV